MHVRMHGFERYTKLSDALKIVLSHIKRLGKEEISFNNSLGRVLASDVISKIDIPPFDRSAVDGYAVIASDTFGASTLKPVELKIVGSIKIGSRTGLRLRAGEAARIMTGAPMPKGADAVVMVEHVKEKDGKIEVLLPVTPGKNVSAQGEDVKLGEIVLQKGRILRPQDVGMLAATGNVKVEVSAKPHVAILSTGAELQEPGKPLKGAKIADVNSYSLSAAVASCGGMPLRLGIVPDKEKQIRFALEGATKSDMVLISGGSSVGEGDVVPDLISELGELLFHGVAMRPGSPTGFGVINQKPVFALPGFPVSSLVAFDMLVRPALRHMQGLPPDRGYQKVRARLGRKVSSTLGRIDVVRVKLQSSGEEFIADPIRVTGSGILSSMTAADGFFLVPEKREGFDEGDIVEVEIYHHF